MPADPDGTGYPPFDPRNGFGTAEKSGGGIERYLAAVLRFKWLILFVTFAGAAAGVVFAKMVPGQYQAQATLWIESPGGGNNAQPIRTGELLESYAWVELLRSYSVLDPVVRQERLYLGIQTAGADSAMATLVAADEFRPGGYRLTVDASGRQFALTTRDDKILIQRGAVGDSIGQSIGLLWVPAAGSLKPSQVVDFSLYDVRAMAQSLAGRIVPKADEDVNFLTVSMVGTNPARTASTVNAVTEHFVLVAADLKRSKLRELSAILQEQLAAAGNNLHGAEVALENFKVNTITLPSDRGTPVSVGLQMTQDPVYSNFFDMKIEREQMQRDRDVIARVLNDASLGTPSLIALQAVPSLAQAPALQESLEQLTTLHANLRTLQQRYTDQNAQVIRLQSAIDDLENRTIPSQAKALLTELETRDGELAELVASASSELQQIPPRVIEEARLERSVQIAEELFTLLQGRYEEARLAAISAIPDVRVLDSAKVPQWTINGSAAIRMLLMFFAGGFGLAVGGAILLDRFDPKVRYPDQVSSDMGLPILGAVPFVKGSDPTQPPEEADHAIEAFREIRMNVQYALGASGSKALTISSAEAGDGKSFVSSNLALSFAQQGHRTLVIDGDIRRGRLHHFLKGVRTPGLSDLLSEKATLQQVLQHTEVPLVSLIGSGTRMHVGPELLGSAAMANHLQELKRQFDIIIIDTPPLGAGVDPYVLATLTGNLLMIVRTGNTHRAFAEAKLKLVDRLPVRILGAILNGIPANHRMYRYYSYLPNYGSQEEDQGVKALVAIN